MQAITLAGLALVSACSCGAQTPDVGAQIGGQVRLQWERPQASAAGPLAAANALAPGSADVPGSGAALEAELRARWHNLAASVTLQQQGSQSQRTQSRAWVNELVATHDAGRWQFSAGKKIVAWDVGYAFRPNDLVQQEERRALIDTLAEGRPVLMVEHFDADTAWSWVWVNPTAGSEVRGAGEPALAGRVYRRHGSLDWHGFARLGAHTGASLGTGLAWVASDTLELHGSLRYLQRADSLSVDPHAVGVVGSDPWQATPVQRTAQVMVGGSWTHQNQLNVLFETWWDGTALSEGGWDAWRRRNAMLAALPSQGAPVGALAGNLAWQAHAFNASSSLQRKNLYLRLSWEHEGWQPSLDLLYHPADAGRMVTAALAWKGDRMQLQGGWRVYGGAADAVLTQLPTRKHTYVTLVWMF